MAKKTTDLSPISQDWLDRLHAEGYRVTAPRRAVVEVIANSEFLLDPADIYTQARQRYSRLGLVTVYRTLEKLEQLGMVQRVHHPDGCQTFIPAVQGHQHLLICQRCNRVQYFSGDGENMDRLMASVSAESAYVIRDHWLQLFGLCPDCQRAAAAS